MGEVLVKTHLIITDIHDEYHMNWCGKIANANPLLQNGLPVFIIIGTTGRIELNTIDMKHIEETAKLLTRPKGRSAITTDTSRVYIKEKNGNDMLLGVMTHKNVKSFAPMFDKVGFQKI